MKLARTFTAIYNNPIESIGWFYDGRYHYITKGWNFRIGAHIRRFSAGKHIYEMIGTKEIMTNEILRELFNADLPNNNVSR